MALALDPTSGSVFSFIPERVCKARATGGGGKLAISAESLAEEAMGSKRAQVHFF